MINGELEKGEGLEDKCIMLQFPKEDVEELPNGSYRVFIKGAEGFIQQLLYAMANEGKAVTRK